MSPITGSCVCIPATVSPARYYVYSQNLSCMVCLVFDHSKTQPLWLRPDLHYLLGQNLLSLARLPTTRIGINTSSTGIHLLPTGPTLLAIPLQLSSTMPSLHYAVTHEIATGLRAFFTAKEHMRSLQASGLSSLPRKFTLLLMYPMPYLRL